MKWIDGIPYNKIEICTLKEYLETNFGVDYIDIDEEMEIYHKESPTLISVLVTVNPSHITYNFDILKRSYVKFYEENICWISSAYKSDLKWVIMKGKRENWV
ncbi:MAG: hypothetical protein SLAVMIC_00422 [uncultured marine phage]|uniref:Uncharacterized protein n=1 Tax=uncultured marine phage TaxID=707152 RepID=A0A8D9CC26_9VIRU|nr:MAG: hypothetical protein SLAVMIC_00422 [uncultured marine phage]